jgi:hypothetical protein
MISMDGFNAFRRNGNAGDKPAAPDGHDDLVEIRRVGQHFQRYGALAGHDLGVVVGMDEDEALPFSDLAGMRSGLVERLPIENDARTIGAGVLGLHQGCAVRHHDSGRMPSRRA